jgi:hypothetical protein
MANSMTAGSQVRMLPSLIPSSMKARSPWSTTRPFLRSSCWCSSPSADTSVSSAK